MAVLEVNSLTVKRRTDVHTGNFHLSLSLYLAIFEKSAPLNVYAGYRPDQTWKYVVAQSCGL